MAASERMAPWRLALVSSLPPPPAKIRVVGRVVGRDVARGTVLLADEGQGLVVDLGIAVGEIGAGYAPLVKDLVMVSGELVWSKSVQVPTLGVASFLAPSTTLEVYLRADSIKACEELDLELWRQAVRAMPTS